MINPQIEWTGTGTGAGASAILVLIVTLLSAVSGSGTSLVTLAVLLITPAALGITFIPI